MRNLFNFTSQLVLKVTTKLQDNILLPLDVDANVSVTCVCLNLVLFSVLYINIYILTVLMLVEGQHLSEGDMAQVASDVFVASYFLRLVQLIVVSLPPLYYTPSCLPWLTTA